MLKLHKDVPKAKTPHEQRDSGRDSWDTVNDY